MKAIVYEKYGPPEVLSLRDVPKPTPSEDELLIEVRAASVNPYDWHFMRGTPHFMRLMFGLFKPKNNILGADIAGEVVDFGRNVTQYQRGDAIFGNAGAGGFAEYVCIKPKHIARKPANISYQQAASMPIAALTALQGLRDDGMLQAGQRVLINGASGGVGTFAVQIAKALGAHVTGVCSSRNVEMVRSIGADHVIDYTQENFTQLDQRYDLILDNVANHTISDYMRVLNAGGRCVVPGYSMSLLLKIGLFGKLATRRTGKYIGLLSVVTNSDDLQQLAELLEQGKVVPVIDRQVALHATPEAVAYVETGRARGKVVIDVAQHELADVMTSAAFADEPVRAL